MTALRVLDAVQIIVTGRIHKYNNKAAKAARAEREFHPEGEMMLERAKYIADELEYTRHDIEELLEAARTLAEWDDDFLRCASTRLEFHVQLLRLALAKFEPQP